MYEKRTNILNNAITKDKNYFSDRLLSINECLHYIYLMSDFMRLYELLNEAAKIKIAAELDQNYSIDFIAYFRNETISNHITYLQSKTKIMRDKFTSLKIPTLHTQNLMQRSIRSENKIIFINFCIELYTTSKNFDLADENFNCYIEPIIDILSIIDITFIFSESNNNQQIYDRRRANSAHKKLFAKATTLDSTFSIAIYKNISIV